MYFLLFLLSIINAYSKEISIINSETGLPISSVSVYFNSTNNSKLNGKFILSNQDGKITLPDEYEYNITLKHISFDNLTINIKKENFPPIIKLTPKSFYVEEIVTTGQIRPTTQQKSTFEIKVIDEASIDARATPTLRGVLINETNLGVGKDGVLGSNLSINGIGGENVKIMVDGVPLIGRENGSINLDQVNVKNAERIEIIQGPMSAIYGSDALGGVINIISKSPKDNIDVSFDSYNESVGAYNINLISNYKNENNSFSLNLSRNLFQGFSPTNTFRAQLWDPRIQYFGDLKYVRNIGDLKLSYAFNYMNDFILNRSEPIDAPYNELGFDDEYKTNRYMNSLNLAGKVADNRYINIITNYSYYDRNTERYLKDLVTLKRTLTKDNQDQKFSNFYSFMSRGTYSHDEFFEKYSYQLGYEVRYDNGGGDKINTTNSAITDVAMFFTSEYKPIEKLVINPMFRVIYNSKYNAPVIPVLNLKYDIFKNSSLRASFSKGFRSPSIKELNLEFIDQNHYIIGNKNLNAENSYTLNFSLDYNFTSLKHVVKATAKYFFNDISNQISLVNIGFDKLLQQQVYSYANINKFKSEGFQLNLSYFRNKISNNLSLAYIGNWTSFLNEYNFTPELSYNLDYLIEDIDLRVALFYKYTGKVVRFGYIGENIDKNEVKQEDLTKLVIESYQNLDLNLSKYLFDKKLKISLGIKNLFDVTNVLSTGSAGGSIHDSNSGSLPMNWGRTYFIDLNYNYN